ncbi:hypothetical protein M431DRAFT_357522 [Trichoderma harzianum CBS 226.95]|uniref:Uncharacterized protein n=1 Tax=Trichoderma harzianum CBS 226.95 TaxID=983964 RepID=A0A2T4ALW5_TRIHA|nr:hypothetical protein M431DRAFT_357522 [Trichoderma harzianum CBS 226.95]PTB58067.1 hypothetical protein M431DRAFT_357522 [Trichoderma harzianum CBS 226.95]
MRVKVNITTSSNKEHQPARPSTGTADGVPSRCAWHRPAECSLACWHGRIEEGCRLALAFPQAPIIACYVHPSFQHPERGFPMSSTSTTASNAKSRPWTPVTCRDSCFYEYGQCTYRAGVWITSYQVHACTLRLLLRTTLKDGQARAQSSPIPETASQFR